MRFRLGIMVVMTVILVLVPFSIGTMSAAAQYGFFPAGGASAASPTAGSLLRSKGRKSGGIATPTPSPTQSSAISASPVLFGVYPGGGTGETGSAPNPDPSQVLTKLSGLRGSSPFSVHLYTAWSWYDPAALDSEIDRYAAAGYLITLTVKYSPPSGHDGDVQGYADFVRSVVSRYGANPQLYRVVIGNEINVANGDPNSSDGPFANVMGATVQGVLAAKSSLDALSSRAQVGIDLAVLSRDADADFTASLVQLGGPTFVSAVSFLGLNVYPGLWPVGTGDAYSDMVTYLGDARYALTYAGFGSAVSIDVLENGYPTLDAGLQASKVDAFVQAVCQNAAQLGISGYSWFDLWDANSASTSIYDHYGLLQSNLSAKPAFASYQQAMTTYCSRP